MAGNPRDHVKDKGFWDGGSASNSENGQSAGRASGFPGTRAPKPVGLRTDIEFPPREQNEGEEPSGNR